jgi:hypothetical protein
MDDKQAGQMRGPVFGDQATVALGGFGYPTKHTGRALARDDLCAHNLSPALPQQRGKSRLVR